MEDLTNMRITSSDIEKMSRMTADEKAAYIEAKIKSSKSFILSTMTEAFNAAFADVMA